MAIAAQVWPEIRMELASAAARILFSSWRAFCRLASLPFAMASGVRFSGVPSTTPRIFNSANALLVLSEITSRWCASPIVLRHGGHDPNGDRIGLGHIDADERHTRIAKGEHESDVAGKPVELGDQQDPPLSLSVLDGLHQFGAVVAFARLDVGVIPDYLPAAAEEGYDASVLRAQTKARSTLVCSRDAVVGHPQRGVKMFHGLAVLVWRAR